MRSEIKVDLGVDASGVGASMAEVIAHLLEAPSRLHEVPGAGMSQAVRPAAFLRQPVLWKVALNDVVEPTCRQRPVWRTQRQEDDPAVRLGSAVAQIARNGIANPGFERSGLLAPALGSDEADPIVRPVDVVEAQPAHFARAEAVHRQQQDDRVVSDRSRVVAVGLGEHPTDGVPRRAERQSLMAVDARQEDRVG